MKLARFKKLLHDGRLLGEVAFNPKLVASVGPGPVGHVDPDATNGFRLTSSLIEVRGEFYIVAGTPTEVADVIDAALSA